MGAEQTGGLGVVDRKDIGLEELETLSQVVYGPTAADIDNEVTKNPITDFLETFATPAQLEAFEMAAEGSITSDSKESTLWPRFRAGILFHPAVIGKLVTLSGLESLDNIDEPAWKDQGDCKEDTRFVSAGGHRPLEETRELMAVCEGCPVMADCQEYVDQHTPLNYGFWAGVSRSKGSGYHNDGTPITLEEKRERIGAGPNKAA